MSQVEQSSEVLVLGLGDIVSYQWADDTGYDHGTVCQVHKDGTVDIFRPYIHAVDFSYAGDHEGSSKCITYIGHDLAKNVDPKTAKLKLLRKHPGMRY